MSITRRLLHLARANLNALLDRAAEMAGEDDLGGIGEMSDEELEAELDRRKNERTERARAEASGQASGGQSSARSHDRVAGSRENKIAQYYAQLEVPYGSDLDTVKQAYRRLMRKYHPDLQAAEPEKQRIATELTQALTRAYQELEQALRQKAGKSL
jgi:DnaJ-domain-containing protein 1